MSVITDILSAPVKGVLDGAADIISKFVKDPTAALQAQVQLSQMDANLQIAMVNADQKFADSQAQVIEAETKEGWLAGNWRPLLMLTFTFIILNNYVLDAWFHIGKVEIPPDMWALLKLGITGYIVGRSAEKFVPDTAASIASMLTKTPAVASNPVVISSDYFSKIADAGNAKVL